MGNIKITGGRVGANKARNYQSYKSEIEFSFEGTEEEYDATVKRLQAKCRKSCNDQLALDKP